MSACYFHKLKYYKSSVFIVPTDNTILYNWCNINVSRCLYYTYYGTMMILSIWSYKIIKFSTVQKRNTKFNYFVFKNIQSHSIVCVQCPKI